MVFTAWILLTVLQWSKEGSFQRKFWDTECKPLQLWLIIGVNKCDNAQKMLSLLQGKDYKTRLTTTSASRRKDFIC